MVRTRAFLSDNRASIMPIFALALASTLGLVGAAIDYSRANAVKASFQSALDSTVLALADKAATLGESELKAMAQSIFDAQFKKYDAATPTIDAVYSNTNGSKVTVSGSTTLKTQFLRIPGFGIDEISIGGKASAAWGNSRMRVALALDNTGSMNDNGKMTALKTAAKNLIDQLKTAATNDGDVYVSIVPFSKDVNVGPDNKDATWLKWTEWSAANGTCSKPSYTTQTQCESNGKVWTAAGTSTWNGCVEDRDQSYDTTNDEPTNIATRFPAEQYSGCPVPLMPLSYSWQALKDKIDAMTPAGYTNTTIGLEWAWHSLTQGAPLNPPAEDANYQQKKVIIFLTDGMNTQNRWWTSWWNGDSNQQKIDARMKLACQNVKNAGVSIYTILVIDGNEQLLKECASSSDKYFKITSSGQLSEVFSKIGSNLTKLHIAE
jgi:Mg-chelatase subunit ChlD